MNKSTELGLTKTKNRLDTHSDSEIRNCLLICGGDKKTGQPKFDLQKIFPEPIRTRKRLNAKFNAVRELMAAGKCLPIDLRSEFVGNMRYVLGELTKQEQDEWIGRTVSRLDLSSGLLICGYDQLTVPPGNYDVEVLCYLPGEAAQQCLETVTPKWKSTRSVAANVGACWDDGKEVKGQWSAKASSNYVHTIVRLAPAADAPSVPELATTGWGPSELELAPDYPIDVVARWECRQPAKAPHGIPTRDVVRINVWGDDDYDEFDDEDRDDDVEMADAFVDAECDITGYWELMNGFHKMDKRLQGSSREPVDGAPVVLPFARAVLGLEAAVNACHEDLSTVRCMLRVTLPPRKKLPRVFTEDREIYDVRTDGDRVDIGCCENLVSEDLDALASIPVGCQVELCLASIDDQPSAVCRFAGKVDKKGWNIDSSWPPFHADDLKSALDLSMQAEDETPLVAGDTDEQKQVAQQMADFFGKRVLRSKAFQIKEGTYHTSDEIYRAQVIRVLFQLRFLTVLSAADKKQGWGHIRQQAKPKPTPRSSRTKKR